MKKVVVWFGTLVCILSLATNVFAESLTQEQGNVQRTIENESISGEYQGRAGSYHYGHTNMSVDNKTYFDIEQIADSSLNGASFRIIVNVIAAGYTTGGASVNEVVGSNSLTLTLNVDKSNYDRYEGWIYAKEKDKGPLVFSGRTCQYTLDLKNMVFRIENSLEPSKSVLVDLSKCGINYYGSTVNVTSKSAVVQTIIAGVPGTMQIINPKPEESQNNSNNNNGSNDSNTNPIITPTQSQSQPTKAPVVPQPKTEEKTINHSSSTSVVKEVSTIQNNSNEHLSTKNNTDLVTVDNLPKTGENNPIPFLVSGLLLAMIGVSIILYTKE